MKNKLFGFLMITVLLWSCGSQFTRSKYDRYMWNRSNESSKEEAKTETAELQNKGEKTPAVATGEAETTLGVLANVDENTLGFISTTDVSPLEFHAQEQRAGFHSDLEEIQSVKELPKNNHEGKKIGFLKKRLMNRLSKMNPGQGSSNSDLTNIIMIILLIILIILAFTLLNSLLGGALGTILGIVLLVLLIYFILRLLGAV